jgi:hypothetical protein
MRKGRPEASLAVACKQRSVTHIPGPVGRVIPCRGLASRHRGTTVHTTRSSTPYQACVETQFKSACLVRGVTLVRRHRQYTVGNKRPLIKMFFSQKRLQKNKGNR